jgi:hypothetical protein
MTGGGSHQKVESERNHACHSESIYSQLRAHYLEQQDIVRLIGELISTHGDAVNPAVSSVQCLTGDSKKAVKHQLLLIIAAAVPSYRNKKGGFWESRSFPSEKGAETRR